MRIVNAFVQDIGLLVFTDTISDVYDLERSYEKRHLNKIIIFSFT